MNVFAKFDEILSMILQDIKETKRYRRTVGQSDVRTDVKTVYPPTNTFCGGIISCLHLPTFRSQATIVSEKSTVFTFSFRKT